MLKDGSKAIDIKNFLVSQDRCEVVTIEGRDYYGKASDKVSYLVYLFVADSDILCM